MAVWYSSQGSNQNLGIKRVVSPNFGDFFWDYERFKMGESQLTNMFKNQGLHTTVKSWKMVHFKLDKWRKKSKIDIKIRLGFVWLNSSSLVRIWQHCSQDSPRPPVLRFVRINWNTQHLPDSQSYRGQDYRTIHRIDHHPWRSPFEENTSWKGGA